MLRVALLQLVKEAGLYKLEIPCSLISSICTTIPSFPWSAILLTLLQFASLLSLVLDWDGLMVSMSASHVVGHGFVPWQGHTKDHHEKDTNCSPTWHAGIRIGVWQCNLTVIGQIVCGSVYGDMHYDLLGSIARVGHCIPVLGLCYNNANVLRKYILVFKLKLGQVCCFLFR